MAITFNPVITSAGVSAAIAANGGGLQLQITHVALGAGKYNPTGAETALVDRREKALIAGGSAGAAQFSVLANFLAYGGAEYDLGEVGFYAGDPDSGGILFAVASRAGLRYDVRSASVEAFSTNFSVALSGVPSGSVTVVIDTGASTVTNLLLAYVRKVGDTMTGPLVLFGNAVAPLQAVPLQQLTAALAGFATDSQGLFTPALRIGGVELVAGGGAYLTPPDGRWFRIGKRVEYKAYIKTSNLNGLTGPVTIALGSLPASDANYPGDVSVDLLTGLASLPTLMMIAGQNYGEVRSYDGVGSSAAVITHANLTAAATFYAYGSYFTLEGIMKTGVITYSVAERGRKYRGVPRNFDAAGLAAVVNSGEVQERVKNRDMLGYFGHWPRQRFGMIPGEGGIVDGKQVPLEPAIVTTMLRADAAGNIEHEAEFLDTSPGRTAKRMFSSRVGGFSSAIDCRPRNGIDVPVGFYGFDYVTEPNFSTNRGYALDGVMEGAEGVLLDSTIAESQVTLRVLDGLYNALQRDYDRTAEVLARLQEENEQLMAMLASKAPGLNVAAALDSTYSRPALVARTSRLLELASEFKAIELQPYGERPKDAEQQQLDELLRSGGRLT